MAKGKGARPHEASMAAAEREADKEELQRQMMEARESISQTVDEIKETVEDQYESVKKTVTGVFDLREQFQSEPILWSVGALSAGFALGYTLGYAHKNTRSSRGKRSEVAAFADSLVDELSTVGTSLVMPSLNAKIKELFGFDFSDLLEEIGDARRATGRKSPARRGGAKKGGAKKRAAAKTRARKRASAS